MNKKETKIQLLKQSIAIITKLFELKNRKPTRLSKNGFDLLVKHEGYRQKAYVDSVGVLTIGIGTSAPAYFELAGKKLTKDTTTTRAEAQVFVHRYFENNNIYKMLNETNGFINQNQYDAMCSFLYNVGSKAFRTKHSIQYINNPLKLIKVINTGETDRQYTRPETISALMKLKDYNAVANCMTAWRSPVEIRGRRQKEVLLFIKK